MGTNQGEKDEILKAQNLPGVLPPELARLPYLQEIDLTRNYLNGTIPPEWGSIFFLQKLTFYLVPISSLIGNQLTGSIPKALVNISTLTSLTLEFNNLSGDFPAELGSLPRIERIRISDNQFSGQIPNFIQNRTKLEKLVIQASGMVGPIPSGIATLEKLTDLRISDLNGTEATFPPLSKMKMKILILRSCNIIGKLPEYLGQTTTLKTLYLTGNLLTGPVPAWMLEKGDMITGIIPCLGSSRCQKTWYSLHINCGVKDVVADANTKYEADTDPAGPSRFFTSRTNWGFSSTGHFLDDDTPWKTYIWQNTNTSRLLTNDSELYTRARLSPISLTYYGYCLGNGNYTVNLHFAEIMFTDDNTFSSCGKRILDVYIQGVLVLKDFNIEDEAGAVGKAIIKRFPVAVTNSTLDIRFYWAGNGTIGIPYRGIYGPLISAISVSPDFIPPPENGSSSSISVGTAVGFVAGAVVALILVAGILWWKGCLRPKSTLERVRPTMSSVVSMLEGRAAVPDSVADSTVTTDDAKFEAFRNYYQSGRDHTKTSNQSQSMSNGWTINRFFNICS
ncbi:hypothetical protein Patl1_04932 [Pistacia atlantica]|uniref:Uncharacterized protein n=1 Tax=Pistacia atlantica TaxID=434234 RepID=A0ACC1BV60_9ROSI|nr:hypothetical protein Patl1_04932 [Pistacia atlantica]